MIKKSGSVSVSINVRASLSNPEYLNIARLRQAQADTILKQKISKIEIAQKS